MAGNRRIVVFLLFVLLIAGIFLIFRNGFAREVRGRAGAALDPLFSTASRIHAWVDSSVSEKRTRALEEENRRLKASLFLLEGLREENAGLRRVIGFDESHPGRFVRARVLLFTREQGREVLLLDRGEEAGIRQDAAVIDDALLLVGRVRESGSGFAKVDVASNPDAAWEVEIGTSTVRAVAQGVGGRAFFIDYIPHATPLAPGALVSTRVAGSALLLGEVARVRTSDTTTFQEVRAILLADPARLSFVGVFVGQ